MATVHLPAPLRQLTGGVAEVVTEGSSLGAIIDRLEEVYPGIRSRLVDNGRLRRGMAAFIDGNQAAAGLNSKVGSESEVYFSPAISGG